MGPTHGSEGRCSIREVELCSREGCLHGAALGSHEKSSLSESTFLRPKSTLRVDVDQILWPIVPEELVHDPWRFYREQRLLYMDLASVVHQLGCFTKLIFHPPPAKFTGGRE